MSDVLTLLAALTRKDDNGLLPCPVCGTAAKVWTDARTIHRHWRAGCTAISCVAIKARTQADAVTRWNSRPREAALIALVTEAAAEIERLIQKVSTLEWAIGRKDTQISELVETSDQQAPP